MAVPLGSHLIDFWHTEDEFERGVSSLELGIAKELIQRARLGPGHGTRTVTMPKLERSQWYDLCRDMNWRFKWLKDTEVFPKRFRAAMAYPRGLARQLMGRPLRARKVAAGGRR